MALKAKLREVLEAQGALATLGTYDVPAKTAYRIGKLQRAVEREVRDFSKTREERVKKFGTEVDGKPGTYRLDPAKREAFTKEIDELLDEEVELEGVTKVNYVEIENLDLKPMVFAGLGETFLENAPE